MGRRRRNKKSEFQWVKYLVLVAIFSVFVVGLAIYFLPFITYYQIETSIVTKDASKLASQMDLEALRHNLKAQKGQRVIKTLKKDLAGDQNLVDLAIVWSALTSDQAIDRAISTEGFYILLSGAVADHQRFDPIKPPPEIDTYQMIKKLTADSSFQYRSLSKFVVSVKDEKGRYVEYFAFIFTRNGLHWCLTNVLLPVF